MVLPDFSIPQIASFFVKDIADLPAPTGEVHEDISRAIHLPETFEQRKSRRVSNPFKFDFFISKVTPGKKIKWLPTNSPEKKSKLNYKPASYFLDKLESLKGKSYLERQLEIIKELDEKTKIS